MNLWLTLRVPETLGFPARYTLGLPVGSLEGLRETLGILRLTRLVISSSPSS